MGGQKNATVLRFPITVQVLFLSIRLCVDILGYVVALVCNFAVNLTRLLK